MSSLDKISKFAGVDFHQLKSKYINLQTNSSKNAADETKISEPATTTDSDMQRLDNYKICKVCLGKGTVKRIYNHMVLERDCDECDGNSIVYCKVDA